MKFRLSLLVAALVVLPWLRAQVYLSEFLANNTRGLRDENNEFSDWIEIHNDGGTAVNLLGWGLTDDPDLPYQWRFPSTNIPPNSFIVVFASAKNRTVPGANLHTSFTLSADEGYLALFPPESETPATEYAPYPRQSPDVSFGLIGAGRNFFNPPTPRAANTAGLQDLVGDTSFSHDRGFYTAPFDLVISTATAGATIRYTTNGATPTVSTGLIYAGPVPIRGTTVIRAAAFREGFQPSDVDTQTYLFVGDILRQSPNGAPPPGWPTSWGNGQVTDYGMDPDIVNSPAYRNELTNAILSLPSFCIVTDLGNLFNTSTGIYANANGDGRTWERPASLELIYPDGTEGFQENCGLRIRGGFSRSGDNPKHAFRFFFREQYGKSKLEYPVFGPTGPEKLEQFDLRTFQNYSWSFGGDPTGVFFRDVFSRDTQLAMGRAGERGEYYHLFVNGVYWGVFNSCERPEASFGENYFGGSKDDYDVVKVEPDAGYTVLATDGTTAAWNRLYAASRTGFTNNADYFRVQGRAADGTPDSRNEVLIDVPSLIDYMLVIFHTGNFDAPISRFLGETSPNNFFGLRSRSNRMGFHFISHDAEHTLRANEPGINRTGPLAAGSDSVTKANPQYLLQRLAQNPEFRLTFADHVQRHYFNGGVLTPESSLARIAKRTNEIFSAVVAESARWGDSKRPTSPLTRNDHWIPAVRDVQQTFVGTRNATVLQQYRNQGWLSSVVAPSFSKHGGNVSTNEAITLSAPAGTIRYTLDGSDPRLVGGAVAPSAQTWNATNRLTFTDRTTVKARVLNGTTWSALTEAVFIPIYTYTDLLITEIMYRPRGGPGVSSEDFEFLELKNVSGVELNLGGVHFTNGITFAFPTGTRLAPGRFAVLAANPATFTNRYPGVRYDGVFSGRLSDGGERLTLVHAAGATIFNVRYDNNAPWPESADGVGFSIVPVNPNANPAPDSAANWRASAAINGSPGADDPVPSAAPVLITEVLTHTDPPQLDAVELFNAGAAPANVSGWFITDDRRAPRKFRIPAGTTIPAGGYAVFTETDFDAAAAGTNAFTFSSHGDEAYLYSADAAGNLTGYSDGFAFGAAANGVTFGRHTNSVGEIEFPAQRANTLGALNAGPLDGPVVLNEILYAPVATQSEFVELRNVTDAPVPLFDPAVPTNTWRINGTGFTFPPDVTLPPRGLALVVAGEPEAARLRLGLPAEALIFGPLSGSLANEGERLELLRPDSPDFVTNNLGAVSVVVPYVVVDAVRYDNNPPWPTNAATDGLSLERRNPPGYGNDPANWFASPGDPSPGTASDANRPPRVNAGGDVALTSVAYPVTVRLNASALDDGRPAPMTFRWSVVSGSSLAEIVSPTAASTDVRLPGQGAWVFRFTANDGERTSGDDVEIRTDRPLPGPMTLLPAGATWRYLDAGPAPAADWPGLDFNDSAWRTGAAEFGYGDGDEATVLDFGGDANNKRITYHFRNAFNVTNAAGVRAATLRLVRDDGAIVYLNGTEITRQNLPDTNVVFSTTAISAVGGADETAFFDTQFDESLLREGRNVIAAEIHQSGGNSSDLGFNLAITANFETGNRPPAVSARVVSGPATTANPILLRADVADDGLPSIPGAPMLRWERVSGPGGTSFSPTNSVETEATVATPGTYVWRATVSDGELTASADVTVEIRSSTVAPVLSISHNGAQTVLTFVTAPGQSYAIRRRDDLSAAGWTVVRTIPAGTGGENIMTVLETDTAARFYQVITPAE